MSNSITWTGNKGPDQKASSYTMRQTFVPTKAAVNISVPTQDDKANYSPEIPVVQQNPPKTDIIVPMQVDPVITDIGLNQQGPPPSTEKGFIPYYLTTNIGKSVRAEFIIGSDQYADKTGILIEVGINYFVLEDVNSRTHIMCDLYSVKFVTILQDFSIPQ